MQRWMLLALVAMLAHGCGKKEADSSEATSTDEGDETAAASGDQPPPDPKAAASQPPAAVEGDECHMQKTEALVDQLEASLGKYMALEFPPADASCETLRVFSVDLAPLAQRTKADLEAISSFSQSLSEECRARNKATHGARVQKMMTDMAPALEPKMTAFEEAVRACADHPGMAEAFQNATFKAAR